MAETFLSLAEAALDEADMMDEGEDGSYNDKKSRALREDARTWALLSIAESLEKLAKKLA